MQYDMLTSCSSCCCNILTACAEYDRNSVNWNFPTRGIYYNHANNTNIPFFLSFVFSSISCSIFRALSYKITANWWWECGLILWSIYLGLFIPPFFKTTAEIQFELSSAGKLEIMWTHSVAAFSCFCSLTYTLMWRSRKVLGNIGETCRKSTK